MITSAGEQPLFKDPVHELQKQFDKTRELFGYLITFLTEVARYAETDARRKASKNLPSADDLNVNIKVAGNELLWQILENISFQKAQEQDKHLARMDKDMVKQLYNQLIVTEEYKSYINEDSRNKLEEKNLLSFIFNTLMLPNEDFEQHIEEHFNNWDDDGEMMQQLINNFLQKPKQNMLQMLTPEKWNYAKQLLTTVLEKREHTLELIKPKLKNWDADRIAVLDMILLQMGLCELLYFETIPTKVTINEYIDLAKEYSTPQSGQFVNGILDNLHKELLANNKIHKVDFKSAKS
jgi:N utilization substance protein B